MVPGDERNKETHHVVMTGISQGSAGTRIWEKVRISDVTESKSTEVSKVKPLAALRGCTAMQCYELHANLSMLRCVCKDNKHNYFSKRFTKYNS